MSDAPHRPRGRWAALLLGGPQRLGLWTLPLFVAVGLLGAVLAGSLATVYYSQRVRALEAETAAARRDLAEAVTQVTDAARRGVRHIEAEVASVRDALAVTLPVPDPAASGIVAVRATVGEPVVPPPGPGATAPPAPPRRTTRTGSGFAVVTDDDGTFFVTSFAVVADPARPGVPVRRAEVLLGGRFVTARVHAWDPRRDLAVLRVRGVAAKVIPWRPATEAVSAGGQVFALGLTPNGSVVQVRTVVAGAEEGAVLLATAVPEVLRGGPLLDADGRVVAVVSAAYAPYGERSGPRPAIPVRVLCDRLVRCAEADRA